MRNYLCLLLVLLLAAFSKVLHAQPGFSVDIKKEKPFEERKLKAEKTGDGPIKTPKRIFTNLTTRFNYVFNANVKFNEILERAKLQHKDDFPQLLTFYPYTLEATVADSAQLDSVIYKCRTGIVNHDLRNEWGDELYLLWAASWHLQKKLDSASLMLQFINYAYAPQEEYGYYSYVGSRKEGSQEISIATPEKKKFLHSNTFSRNNAFIWQIRTMVERENFASSGSLITNLKRDPVFPKRLHTDLAEAEAYWFYKQGRWDSAALYLTKALDAADNKREKARWMYLIAQLLERSGKSEEAAAFYSKAVSATPDPVMEVYGRLNLVRISKEGGENAIDKNVAELLKMAKRDKYEEYRDIIYYMAAQMEMERNNIAGAQELLMKGAKYNNGNQAARSKAFLQIADVSFDQKKYIQAGAFYDSIQLSDISQADVQRVESRKPSLKTIAENSAVVTRQDSLQRVAAMPKEEQEDYIKKLVKRLRKEQGLKEEAAPTAGSQGAATAPAADLFSSGKGEWYFYNTSSRTQGAAEFKQIWGKRPNVDNWRRFAVVSQQLNRPPVNANDPRNGQPGVTDVKPAELTQEALLAGLPVTPEAIKSSNDSIRVALMNLGSAYINEIEDYLSAIITFEEIRKRFPDAPRMDEVLFNLYYAYTKTGNAAQAAQIKKLLQERYPSSRYNAIVTTGKDPQAKSEKSPEATKAYEDVYNQFIEGRFEQAIAAKRLADSTYKTTFWQPQLLYIEAVYYIKQREDSVAKASLQTIIRQNSVPALTSKAETLLSVLNRRQQIEDELNRYQMQTVAATDSVNTVKKDTVATRVPMTLQVPPLTPPKKDTIAVKPPVVKAVDTIAKKIPAPKPADTVVKKIVTPKVKDTVAKKPPVVKAIDTVSKKPVVKPLPDTLAKKGPVKKATDTVAKKQPVTKRVDTVAKKPVVVKKTDTLVRKPEPAKPYSIYAFTPEAPHIAVMILDKVDPVFVNEARNAFFRFNREKYYGQPLDAQIVSLTTDIKLLLVSGFTGAEAATDYAQRVKAIARTEIIPWLTGNKYTFTVISAANLEILKGTTNLAEYRKFLEQYLPGKF